MCGIVGIVSFNKVSSEKTRKEVGIHLFTELLEQTEVRGRDATGVATLYADGNFFGQKGGIPAKEYLAKGGEEDTDFCGFLKLWRTYKEKAVVSIGHCRNNSVGNTTDNANNHPIKVGSIVGIHNGTLKNHDQIFEKLKSKRDGDVDSEAIMRLFHKFTKNGKEPFTVGMLQSVSNKLDGTFSVLVFNGNNPFQLAAMNDGRPMVVALIKQLKMLVIASEMPFIEKAIVSYNKASRFYNNKLPYLDKKHIIFKTFTDGSASVFYLERDITEATTIEELCDSGRLSLITKEDDWKMPVIPATKVVYSSGPRETYKAPSSPPIVPDVKKSEILQLGHVGSKNTDKNQHIRLWNNITSSYDIVDKRYAAFMATVIINLDLETLELTHVSSNEASPITMGFDASGNTKRTDPVKLERISLVDVNLSKPIIVAGPVDKKNVENKIELQEEKFSTMEDISNYLKLPYLTVVSKSVMELCTLVRKSSIIEASLGASKEKQIDERLLAATNMISALKGMVKAVLNSAKREVPEEKIHEVVSSVNLEQDMKLLKKVFRDGDFIACTPLLSVKGLRGEVNETEGNIAAIQ